MLTPRPNRRRRRRRGCPLRLPILVHCLREHGLLEEFSTIAVGSIGIAALTVYATGQQVQLTWVLDEIGIFFGAATAPRYGCKCSIDRNCRGRHAKRAAIKGMVRTVIIVVTQSIACGTRCIVDGKRLSFSAVDGRTVAQGVVSCANSGEAADVVCCLVAHKNYMTAQCDGITTAGTVLIAAIHTANSGVVVVVVDEGSITCINTHDTTVIAICLECVTRVEAVFDGSVVVIANNTTE